MLKGGNFYLILLQDIYILRCEGFLNERCINAAGALLYETEIPRTRPEEKAEEGKEGRYSCSRWCSYSSVCQDALESECTKIGEPWGLL
jgi:hypothetical protein